MCTTLSGNVAGATARQIHLVWLEIYIQFFLALFYLKRLKHIRLDVLLFTLVTFSPSLHHELIINYGCCNWLWKKEEGEERQRQGIPEKQIANPKQERNLCTVWILISK